MLSELSKKLGNLSQNDAFACEEFGRHFRSKDVWWVIKEDDESHTVVSVVRFGVLDAASSPAISS